MRKSIFILSCLLSTIISAQNLVDLDCETGFKKIQTELESKPQVDYKLIYSQKKYGEESFEFSEGIIIVNNIDDLINQNDIAKIIGRIGVENNLTKVIALRNCDAGGLYLRQNELTTEQKNYLSQSLIAEINIDLLKSLSKKERKKQKKKRDLIESVSNKSCEKLAEFGTDKLTMESFNTIVSTTSAEFAEKTMEIYEMPFEQSVDKFLKDLMNHLLFDCQLVQEFANNQ
ncbi:hypothetical protein [Gelidibacter gilvus]|uniref:DUF4476 domain-containing protein n=1 Tax=Gelidibacter gilvus TaxID=59602 RepID=A0A4Q0XE26_9FLAO|nr:hypothetical protein [Gelidibacter gilvus]RXJ44600.1 hypothetical protein ESZ48_16710 [Gelidibacter gilvus]